MLPFTVARLATVFTRCAVACRSRAPDSRSDSWHPCCSSGQWGRRPRVHDEMNTGRFVRFATGGVVIYAVVVWTLQNSHAATDDELHPLREVPR
jgi:hypothetical protein